MVNPLKDPTQKVELKVMKEFSNSKSKKYNLKMLTLSLVVVVAGVLTGWLLSGRTLATQNSTTEPKVGNVTNTPNEAGISDTSEFPDEAEGTLVEGGIEGEGTHHLDRDLGPEKYVYLTSTVIDLQSFAGKKVHVWGQTVSGKHAGWLMDVGKLQVVK